MLTFDELKKLDNVDSVGSDMNVNPLEDKDLTIFFANGYRLISVIDILGQSISLEPFHTDRLPNDAKSYFSEIYHEHENPSLPKGHNKHYVKDNKNDVTKCSKDEFMESISPLVGEEVMNFLQQRHSTIAYKSHNRPKI